jgi:hypothetical protein
MIKFLLHKQNITFLIFTLLSQLLLVSPVIASDALLQQELASQKKKTEKLEHELQLIQQKYDAQKATLELTTIALNAQKTY